MGPVDSSETMVPIYHSVVVYGPTAQYRAMASCSSGFEKCDILWGPLPSHQHGGPGYLDTP